MQRNIVQANRATGNLLCDDIVIRNNLIAKGEITKDGDQIPSVTNLGGPRKITITDAENNLITGDPTINEDGRIQEVSDPVLASDVATKSYVDSQAATPIGALPIVLNTPGTYRLAENATFSPAAPFVGLPLQAAITIDTDDILVDLDGFNLTQDNLITGVVGIEIVMGHKNVKIINGTIRGFTGCAIHAYTPGTTATPTLENLLFESLTLIDNGGNGDPNLGTQYTDGTGLSLGTDIDQTDPIVDFTPFKVYKNVTISNCQINHNTGLGIVIKQASTVVIKNTNCNDTFLNDAAVIPLYYTLFVSGCQFQASENISITSSTFNNFRSITNTPARYSGLWAIASMTNLGIFMCRNVEIIDTQMNNMLGVAGTVIGFGANGLTNLRCINSQMNNTTSQGFNLVTDAFHNSDTGDFVASGPDATASGMFFTGCQFNGTTGLGTSFSGVEGLFVSSAQNVTMDNCQVVGCVNKSANAVPGRTAGILFTATPTGPATVAASKVGQIVVRNCQIGDFTVATTGLTGSAIGISFSASYRQKVPGTLENVTVENCDIARIINPSTGVTAGIVFANISGLSVKRTFAKNNRIADIHNSNFTAAGILCSNVNFPNIVKNSVSNADVGVFLENITNVSSTFTTTAGSITSNVATITFNPVQVTPDQAFKVGDSITVAGFTPPTFNGSFTVASTSATTITYAVVTADTTATVMGTVTLLTPSGPAKGVISGNKVDNCVTSGMRDLGVVDGDTNTSSIWTENQVFNCGAVIGDNYLINWPGTVPIQTDYIGTDKWFNLSLHL